VKQRACREAGCGTILSRFNPGDRCWNHTDYTLAKKNTPTAGRARPIPDGFSDALIAGLAEADALTPVEAEWYRANWETS